MLLGEVLVDLGHATRLQVDAALALQRQMGGQVGVILIAIGAVTRDQLVEALQVQRAAMTASA